jgi:predicted nucleic acid-binding protein
VKSYVLDASALLRFIEDGPGAGRIEDLINQAESGRAILSVSSINWGEVYYVIYRTEGPDQAESFSAQFSILPIDVIEADRSRAERAGEFRGKFRLPYADAFAAALTAEKAASLVTADYDFKDVDEVISVEFLPQKQKKPAH